MAQLDERALCTAGSIVLVFREIVARYHRSLAQLKQ